MPFDDRVVPLLKSNHRFNVRARLGWVTCGFLALAAFGCGGSDAKIDNEYVIDGGHTFGKFCNRLTRGGASVEMTLEFGNPMIQQVKARTGTCTTMLGDVCGMFPAGAVPVRLLEGDEPRGPYTLAYLAEGTEYILEAAINPYSGQGVVTGYPLGGDLKCQTYDPLSAGADGGLIDARSNDAQDAGAIDGIQADAGASIDANVAPDAHVDQASSADASDSAVDAISAADTAVDAPSATD